MTSQKNTLSRLIADCWKDEALKKRFESDPKTVLSEYGIDVPEGMQVNVVENSDNTIHITLPVAPESSLDLSDAELQTAAGGWGDKVQINSEFGNCD